MASSVSIPKSTPPVKPPKPRWFTMEARRNPRTANLLTLPNEILLNILTLPLFLDSGSLRNALFVYKRLNSIAMAVLYHRVSFRVARLDSGSAIFRFLHQGLGSDLVTLLRLVAAFHYYGELSEYEPLYRSSQTLRRLQMFSLRIVADAPFGAKLCVNSVIKGNLNALPGSLTYLDLDIAPFYCHSCRVTPLPTYEPY
ncbi:hypothetical protein BDV96DRAFT_589290 [Lophiotrema nucula]|uniref:Uncharacterized protein n=1 Tax=Lophiotrema nucula TaxID=690887 RepID=A0A6A5YJK7_9PLEO|nr:hypothetical protein BDV96DRAFT_589290 [Lophiotrema nucula]